MSAKHALLGLLRERPTYGYQLGERLQQRLGPAWAINSGHLYQTLKRMEREGLIARVDGSGRDRQVFALTDSGNAEFLGWFAQDEGGPQLPRRPLLLKITLAGPDRLKDALQQIGAYERDCADRLNVLSRERAEVPDEDHRVRADHVLLRLGLSADISHLRAELGWSRHAREMVSWLLEQDAIWPGTPRRSGSATPQALGGQDAWKGRVGGIPSRQLQPAPDEPVRIVSRSA
jgi:DNA-binding PadR family transcriptional regulator